MFPADKKLETCIKKAEDNGLLKELTTTHNCTDFNSNDFLGFSKSPDLKDRIFKFSRNLDGISYIGSTGSRLISGNTALIESLENFVATYHHAEAGLIFNSSYDACLGLLSSVPSRNDTILYDNDSHPAVRDGIRLGFAKSFPFKHNDIDDLELKLKSAKNRIFVFLESVSSKDGTIAPLKDFSELCKKHNANLIIDESIATGVFGNNGKGLVVHNELTSQVFARICSFENALGCHGAIILGSKMLRSYLINFSRTFIYSNALPFQIYLTVKSAYDLLNEDEDNPAQLHKNIALFKSCLNNMCLSKEIEYIDSSSPIQSFILTKNIKLSEAAVFFKRRGYDVLLSKTKNNEFKLIIKIHSFNTADEIKALTESINNYFIN